MVMDSIERNVAARKASNTLVELGISLGKDERLDPEGFRLMWKHVIETASQLIGVEEPQPETSIPAKAVSSVVPYEDNDTMPFGKHQGTILGEVPDDYFKWLAQQDWLEDKWPRLLAYIEQYDLDR
jgi:uncharacterized protein (DUF3820 family)